MVNRPRRFSNSSFYILLYSLPTAKRHWDGEPATEFAKRYKFPEVADGMALDGSGQTIAIIELAGGYRNSDLNTFFKEMRVTSPKNVIDFGGPCGK
jgi:hypothetical protein